MADPRRPAETWVETDHEVVGLGGDYRLDRIAMVLACLLAGGLLAFVSTDRVTTGLAVIGIGVASLTVDIRTLERSLVALVVIELTFPIDQYFAIRPDPDRLSFVSGYNVSLTTFALVVLGGLWIGRVPRLRARTPTMGAIEFAALAYTAAVIISSLSAVDIELAGFELAILVQAVALLLYMGQFIRDRSDLLFVVIVLVAALALQAATVALTLRTGDLAFGPLATRTDRGRPGGTLGDPNVLAGYTALMIPIGVGLLLARVRHLWRALGLLGALGGILALFLTTSRGGLLGLAVAGSIYVYQVLRHRWITRLRVGILVVVCGVAALPVLPPVLERVATVDLDNGRWPLVLLAVDMLLDNPWFGVGPNNFGISLENYLTTDFNSAWISTVHNKYLLVWAETGLFALASFVAMMAIAIRRGWPGRPGYTDGFEPLACGMSIGLLGSAVHMFFDIYHSRQQVMSLFLVVGLLSAWNRVGRIEGPRGRKVRPKRSGVS